MIRNALIAIYILVVLAISAVARAGVLPNNAIQGEEVTATELQKYNYKTHVGQVVALEDGSFALTINQQVAFVLQSQFDLTSYVGSKVMISGIELDQQLAPAYGQNTVDPLPGVGSGSNSVIFFVFGISEVR
ncbi:MAG TPA: hypothetical protein VF412_10955 [Bdellovibrio sp.]|uniref:hypothetical protein n=1 Tax=Bdellovibrio sp. TaxID=28201 RepID=UPI002F079BB3